MKSLRRRLTLWLVSAVVTLSVAAGAGLYAYVRQVLLAQFDASLYAKAHALASLVRVERGGRYELEFAADSMPEYVRARRLEYFMVLEPGGGVLSRSPSLEEKNLVDPLTARGHTHAWDLTLPDGRSGRAFSLASVAFTESDDRPDSLSPQAQSTVLVVVARDRADVDRVMATLLSALVVAAAGLAGAAVVAVRLIVAHGLRPVRDVAERTASIGPESLDYRFDAAAVPDELAPICARFNDLLARLEEAFARERRLNADIAHELRTPIAELRALTEVAGRWPTEAEQSAQYLKDAHEIALRMESLVDTLLALARSQSKKVPMRPEPVDPATAIGHALDRHREDIARRDLRVGVDVPEGYSVLTDALMFRRVVENLIANAVEYAPVGGTIQIAARQAVGACVLTFGNTNQSLRPEDLSRVFDPFWRKDPARTGDEHVGLGLALVAEYARLLRITITPQLPSPDWFEIRLLVPAAADPAAVRDAPAHHVPVMRDAENPIT